MEYKDIDKLLEKYFDGKSTSEEEIVIRNFLGSDAGNMEKYGQAKALFSFFASEKLAKSKLTVDKIMSASNKSSKSRRMYFYAMAASIALLISFFFMHDNTRDKEVLIFINGQPIENQEIAIAEAQKALLLISKNLNEGTENLNYLSEFGKAEEILSPE